jgi:2-hydroxychromene-2-carboxylate isomerase
MVRSRLTDEKAPTMPVTSIDFYGSPGCPWTWVTSRWLVDAGAQRGITIQWRNLSLSVLNEGQNIPEQYLDAMRKADAAHRVMTAMRADDRNDLAGAFYTAFGEQFFVEAVPAIEIDVPAIALSVGGLEWADAAGDDLWDLHIREETEEAMALAGPDVGSPVLAWGEPRVAIFGPVVSPAPKGADAATLLDHVVALTELPAFFELKRGRKNPIDFS